MYNRYPQIVSEIIKLEILFFSSCYRNSNKGEPRADTASLETQVVKNPPAVLETWVPSLGWEDPLRREWPLTLEFFVRGFPGGSYQKMWKTQQWPQDWKRSVFIPIPKKGNAKEC